MSATYRAMPPASAPAARRAWRFFEAKWPGRPILEMFYSAQCDGGRAWVCEYVQKDADFDHWGVANGGGIWTKTASPWMISHWAESQI